jgi:hypothetical protein
MRGRRTRQIELLKYGAISIGNVPQDVLKSTFKGKRSH